MSECIHLGLANQKEMHELAVICHQGSVIAPARVFLVDCEEERLLLILLLKAGCDCEWLIKSGALEISIHRNPPAISFPQNRAEKQTGDTHDDPGPNSLFPVGVVASRQNTFADCSSDN